MAKLIIDTFKNGTFVKDRNLPNGFYYTGKNVDLDRTPEFLTPGASFNNIDSSGITSFITAPVADAIVQIGGDGHFTSNDLVYVFSTNRIYRIKDISTTPVLDVTNWAKNGATPGTSLQISATGGSSRNKGAMFSLSGTMTPVIAYKEDATHSYIGTITWDGLNFIFTAQAETLSAYAFSDFVEWNGYLWLAVGPVIDKFDGTNVSLGAFPAITGWTIDCMFTTPDYLGFFISKDNADAKCYLWDGTSTAANKIIPLEGIKKVHYCENLQGKIIFVADAKKTEHIIGTLNDNGYDTSENLRLRQDVNGTIVYPNILGPQGRRVTEIFDNKLLIGANYGLVFSTDGKTLTVPYSTSTNTSSDYINCIKFLDSDRLLIANYNNTTSSKDYINVFPRTTTGALPATYKAGYTDFGQKVRINYIKFYFKPLVSGDSMTVGIDTDYGTTNSLGTISYAVDGAVTFKRFNFIKACHSFRPTISWTAGAIPVSKIVIDYSFIDDV